LKILIVSQYFWPENFRINDFIPELIKRGHEVSILTGKPNYPSGNFFSDFIQNPALFSNYKGAEIYSVPIISRGNYSIQLLLNYLSFVISGSLIGLWRLRKLKPDLIFVYEPSPVTVGIPAVLIGKLKKAPVIFWALDLWPETLQAVGGVRSKSVLWAIEKIVRFIYNNCELVLGQSKSFVKSIQSHCDHPDKVQYFPSWAEKLYTDKRKSNQEYAPEIERNDECFNILFAGNVADAQDMPSVLNAAILLRDQKHINWIIVGDGRRLDWLKSEVKKNKLEENFKILGRFPLERMPSFFAHADALLVSLKKDPVFSMTIPAKLQTYLMTGIPILGMLDGEGAKIIKESNSGISSPASDSASLADAAKKMSMLSLKNKNQLGQNGIKYSKKEFDRSILMDKLENFFILSVKKYNNY
jgi:glycosyltransferase involved in cell wall biosynthesis